MKRLAIIPARGGSKRMPYKNIRPFFGKPVIAYSIEAARACGLFDEIMVSTDDPEIARIAEIYGAKVPFVRSPAASGDFATLTDVITEVLSSYADLGVTFDSFCCILATAPLISAERLSEGSEMLENKSYDSVFPVLKFSYPIQRALRINSGKVYMTSPEFALSRSQDLEPRYHDSGQFYWMKTSEFERQKKLFADNSGAIILSEMEVQDIDNEEDWALAELKYKMLSK